MIPAHQEVDAIVANEVDKPMFLRDAPGPDIGSQVPEGLRLPDALKRISQNGFHELEDSQRGLSVGIDPEMQVLPELILKDRETWWWG